MKISSDGDFLPWVVLSPPYIVWLPAVIAPQSKFSISESFIRTSDNYGKNRCLNFLSLGIQPESEKSNTLGNDLPL